MITALGYVFFYANIRNKIVLFLIGAILIEFGFGIEQAATNVWICDYIKSEVRATYSSIFSTIECLGGFIIVNILGYIIEREGIFVIWLISIGSIFITINVLCYLNYIFITELGEKTNG